MHSTKKLSIGIILAASALGLSACGEGYEMIRTTDYFPYGNARTAGSGVAYVLSSMLPEKEVKLEPKNEDLGAIEMPKEEPAAEVAEAPPAPEAAPAEAPPETLEKMDNVFSDAQRK